MSNFDNTQAKELLARDTALNERIISGDALAAFEEFYADDIVMQENDAAPTIGKDANRQRENDFSSSITEFRSAKVIVQTVGPDTTTSQWHMDYTHKEWGVRNYHQIAVRTWKDGKIAKEVFYYG